MFLYHLTSALLLRKGLTLSLFHLSCAGNFSPAMGARNQVGTPAYVAWLLNSRLGSWNRFLAPERDLSFRLCLLRPTHHSFYRQEDSQSSDLTGFDRRDRQTERGLSKFGISLIEGARIGAMSLLVILFLRFGYLIRSPSGKK